MSSKESTNQKETESHRILLKYALITLALGIFSQLAVLLRDGAIDTLSAAALIPVYACFMWFNVRHRVKLSSLRFGRLLLHVITYLVVITSYHFHALMAGLSQPATSSYLENMRDTWSGALITMTAVWGVFVILHLIVSLSNRGYEHIDA